MRKNPAQGTCECGCGYFNKKGQCERCAFLDGFCGPEAARVLSEIRANGGAASHAEISERLPGTNVTRAIKRLEQLGRVVRANSTQTVYRVGRWGDFREDDIIVSLYRLGGVR